MFCFYFQYFKTSFRTICIFFKKSCIPRFLERDIKVANMVNSACNGQSDCNPTKTIISSSLKNMHLKVISRICFLPVIALSLMAVFSATAATPTPIEHLNDSFSYTNASAMQAAGWTALAGSPGLFDLDSASGRILRLANVRIKKTLTNTPITENFTLTAEVALTKFPSSLYVLLTSAPDADNKIYGYGIAWFSGSTAGTNYPEGTFSINTINGVAESALSYGYAISASGVTASSTVKSGINISGTAINPVAVSEFGSVKLTWEKSTGLLNLYLGSGTTPALSIAGTAYSSFSNIYISGNDTGYFNQVAITSVSASQVPEPRTYALVIGALLAGFVIVRRCRQNRCQIAG